MGGRAWLALIACGIVGFVRAQSTCATCPSIQMNCDEAVTQTGSSCEFLEDFLGCDCSGCLCSIPSPPPAPPMAPPEDCPVCSMIGQTCDQMIAVSSGSFNCQILSAYPYMCDCAGCSCMVPPTTPPAPPVPPAVPLQGCPVCNLIGQTCDQAINISSSQFGEQLDCQRLSGFPYNCDCTGCFCTVPPAAPPAPPISPPGACPMCPILGHNCNDFISMHPTYTCEMLSAFPYNCDCSGCSGCPASSPPPISSPPMQPFGGTGGKLVLNGREAAIIFGDPDSVQCKLQFDAAAQHLLSTCPLSDVSARRKLVDSSQNVQSPHEHIAPATLDTLRMEVGLLRERIRRLEERRAAASVTG